MSQIFEEDGKVVPVTLVEVDSNVVVTVKTKDTDGYEAVVLGTGYKKKISKPLKGQLKDLGNFRYLREFRSLKSGGKDLAVGDKLDTSVFSVGDKVRVAGVTKGRGFQGAVKRHGFKGMPAGHGHRAVRRHVGSIGQRFPQHTRKGMRMAGHMGDRSFTVRGLKVVRIDKDILAIKGAIPGQRGGLLKVMGM